MANGSTMINRFYGMFSIKPTKGSNVRFIIMNNVFDTEFFVHERYDLKGSLDGRTASEKERKRDAPIFKDLDFLEKKRKMRVGPEMKKKIIDQLKADTVVRNFKLFKNCVVGCGCFWFTAIHCKQPEYNSITTEKQLKLTIFIICCSFWKK